MKRSRNLWAAVVALGCVIFASGCSEQINALKARNHLNKGVKAFSASDYKTAVEHFEQAIDLDAELLAARSYRASALMMQYVPGVQSPDNQKIAQQALEGFQNVLEQDPGNQVAMSSIASLYFNMEELKKAKEWNKKLIEKYPDKKEAYYTIGVINWTQAYQPRIEVRAELGMKPEDPGPIKDEEVREELAERNIPLIEEGLDMLARALELDPQYEDAMAYTNLLYRERADIGDEEEYEKYSQIADEWVQRTLETKKKKAEATTVDQFAAEE